MKPGRFIGGALSYFKSSLAYRNQADGNFDDVKSTQLSLYTSQTIRRVFIEGMWGYGWQHYEGTRDTGVAGFTSTDFDGHAWGIRLGGGVPMGIGSRAAFTPEVRFEWDSITQDAYKETGGGPLGLSVGSRSEDGMRSSLGGQLDFSARAGDFKARPFVRGFWHHHFDDDGLNATATFAAGGSSFASLGQNLDRDPYTVGGGINFFTEGAFTAALVYDATFAKSYQSHVYQAKLRWAF